MAATAVPPQEGEEEAAYTFFDSYRYLWSPQRPQRSAEELAALVRRRTDAPETPVLTVMSFEDRVAIRSLFHAVLDDVNLRNLLDGLLLPPPYDFADLRTRRWTEKEVRALCSVLSPSLDWVVVNLPFNLAVRLGTYDARLRAAARRLSWILAIPFSLVEQEEASLAQVRNTVSRDGGAAELANVARQEEVLQNKEQRRRSLTRVATIGGFAVLGGAALVVTGGLAAPIVGPAYAALVTATATTLGAIGAVGGAVLGTGALAAVFATVVGAATHAAALASIVTPALTAANLTAIFGVTGASLGGYKAFRRTTDSDIFALRSIDEVETFAASTTTTTTTTATEAATTAEEDAAELNKEVVRRLACSHQSKESGSGAVGTSWDLSEVLEDDSKPGVVVPQHTRTVAMAHALNLPPLRKRRRHVVFAVDNRLAGYQLHLKAIKILSGVWAMAPPATVPPGHAGVCACVNRFAHPTGAGFIICYVATPLPGTSGAAPLRIWARAERDFFGSWALSAACEAASLDFDPTVAEYWMEEHLTSCDVTRRQQGVALELHVEPYTYLKVYPATTAGSAAQARKVTFPVEELPQRQLEYGHAVTQRRKLSVSLVNRSSHDIITRDMHMANGEQWPETASPMAVYPAEASLTFFTSSGWSLAGAEGYYIVEVINSYSEPVTPRFYVRVQFEVSALNNVNVAFATAYNLEELTRLTLTPAALGSAQAPVELPPGLFFTLTCVVDAALYTVQLVFQDFVERPGSNADVEKMTLTIGVSGYSAIFDPRRPVRDQQVGLWQPVLRRSELLGGAESYALQWEDEYLMRFGETIQVNLDIADNVAKKAVDTATATAKKTLLQGALFTGLHAFSALMGAFQLPLFAVWATGVIDNNFATLSNRSAYTGKDLAVALLDKQHGNRPVTLVGFSFGSRVIVECLRELEKVRAYGVVENVYLLGCTCSSDATLWRGLRRVVAGRLVNVYTREDWTLWMMYRLNKTDLKPMAGITPVNVPGVENVDVTPLVSAHGQYAAKLLPVLDAIPPEPTPTTWSPRQHYGSPGVTVPVKTCRETVTAVGRSLHSYLTATAYAAMAVKNCVVSDLANYEPQVELLTVQLYGCFFDFMPPPLTDAGMASVAGLLGDGETPMGAVVAYRMRLPPSSPRDLLVVLYLCGTADGEVQVCAQPNLVERRASEAETEAQAYQRLCAITAEACQTLEDVQRMCRMHGVEWERRGGAAHVQSMPVAVPNTFADGHRTATVRLVLERIDSAGVTVTWLALLTRESTQLQQEKFDESQFKAAMSALAAASSSHPHHRHGTVGLLMPVVADTYSTDDLQQRLRSLAAQLQDPQKYPASTAPFVLVNCGTAPLYFSETFYNAATAAEAAQEKGEVESATPPPPTCTWAAAAPRWLRFPPPEIPPASFAVTLLAIQAGGEAGGAPPPTPPVRYETSNGECAFDVAFPTAVVVSVDGAPSTAAVRCTAVEGRPCLGQAELSYTTVQATSFAVVMMVPRTSAEDAVKDDDADAADTAESRLHARGWYVV